MSNEDSPREDSSRRLLRGDPGEGERPEPDPSLFEEVVNLCKRRGFVFPSSEIYGGLRSTYDWGPLGALLLQNVRQAWWRAMVQQRSDVVPIEAAVLTSPKVWEASGHLATFTDPLVDCRRCKERWRADQIGDSCPNCGSDDLTEARPFSLMFKTFVGPVEEDAAIAYLRPETAQGMFVNFLNVLQSTRKRPPFGIAQIGRSFRNEITPGNFVFRTREFDQMELEFFVPPEEADRWFEYWCANRRAWYERYGIPSSWLRLRPHEEEELSHYSVRTSDIEFRFPWGWGELEGIANRTDYDLRAHSEASGVRLEYFDQTTGEHYMPYAIEPAGGVTRAAMAFLLSAIDRDEVAGEQRSVLRLHPLIAPYQVAVLPLSKKETLTPLARQVLAELQGSFVCDYDETQAIGRRYRRQDEIGTPFCVTVDFDSIDDKQVTVRERDTTEQVRLPLSKLAEHLLGRFSEAGDTP